MMEKGESQMPAGIQSRTQFLVLAEFCQKVISSLLEYINGRKALQRDILNDARGALKSVQSGDSYRFGQRSAAALSSYEEVRTLEEAWTPQQIDDAIRLTTELMEETEGDHVKKGRARELLALFSKLQTKALWNFEQPRPTLRPDLGELCEALKRA
jgi:hypothetical protein